MDGIKWTQCKKRTLYNANCCLYFKTDLSLTVSLSLSVITAIDRWSNAIDMVWCGARVWRKNGGNHKHCEINTVSRTKPILQYSNINMLWDYYCLFLHCSFLNNVQSHHHHRASHIGIYDCRWWTGVKKIDFIQNPTIFISCPNRWPLTTLYRFNVSV